MREIFIHLLIMVLSLSAGFMIGYVVGKLKSLKPIDFKQLNNIKL